MSICNGEPYTMGNFGHRHAQKEDCEKTHREKVKDHSDASKAKGCQRLMANPKKFPTRNPL